mgnify:CR=1 FL=1
MNTAHTDIQTQRWRRTLLHPSVLLPAFVGATSLIAAAFVGGTMCTFVGVGGMLVAAGIAAYRGTIASEAITQQVKLDLLHKKQRKHLDYLRQLRRKMRGDRDPRTGQLAARLRTIYQHLEQSADTASGDAGGVLPQLHDQARELYHSCRQLLEHSFDLWQTGQDLADEANRQSLANRRENLLGEVQQSVDHLERSTDELRTAALKHRERPVEQSQMRDELSQAIETARAVEQRMVDLETELGLRTRVKGP